MKYYIYQGVGESGELTKIAEVTDQKTYTVTGLKVKTTYRFAVSSYNGLRESAKSNIVTVTTSEIPVQSITITIDKTALEVGSKAKVSVAVTPTDETDGNYTLTSTTPTVATVDQSGNIKAIAPGTTTIKATIGAKTSNVVTIKVYEALVNVSNLTSSDVTTNSVGLSWT